MAMTWFCMRCLKDYDGEVPFIKGSSKTLCDKCLKKESK